MRARDALIVGTVISLLLGAVRPAECQDRKNLLVVQVGAAWPFGETLGLKGWVDAFEFRRQVGARVDASFNVASLFEWDGRGLSSSGYLFHTGAHIVSGRGRARVYYGGGPSVAHYTSQLGVYKALCTICGPRTGLGVYGVAGAERRFRTRLARIDGLVGIEGTIDRVWTTGLVNQRREKTADTWVTTRFNLGFAW